MSKKSNKTPDSDVSARRARGDTGIQNVDDAGRLQSLQTSHKAGSHSTVQKLAASRSGFAPRSADGPVAGAFGNAEPSPSGTGQFRCSACGRFFEKEGDMREHEQECRSAKKATDLGTAELEREDRADHPRNNRGR
jgi:hypothetical protein